MSEDNHVKNRKMKAWVREFLDEQNALFESAAFDEVLAMVEQIDVDKGLTPEEQAWIQELHVRALAMSGQGKRAVWPGHVPDK